MMEPVLEVKHVSASYREGRKEQQVLKDVDLIVRENEILGLVGESGVENHPPRQSWDL